MQAENTLHNWAQKIVEDSAFKDFILNEADKFCYSAPLQILAFSLTETDAAFYQKRASNAALFFNNSLEMEIQKSRILRKITQVKQSKSIVSPAEPASEIIAAPSDNQHIKSEPEPLVFEPLHTTDYFASQGIKLSETATGNDKLGRQLKSFTEWLKTMKKVHPASKMNEDSIVVDNSVEKMAENSNIETEVVTEAMAEVFIQQGKNGKAIEVYEKLSLQNPAKSLYFANKIEQLKA